MSGDLGIKEAKKDSDISIMEPCVVRTLPRQILAEHPEDHWIEDILRPDPDRPTTPETAARALQEKLIKYGYLGTDKPSPFPGPRR
jgi:hypothetical protein